MDAEQVQTGELKWVKGSDLRLPTSLLKLSSNTDLRGAAAAASQGG